MKLSVLVCNMVVSASLLSYVADTSAMSSLKKYPKTITHYVKNTGSYPVNDVWERIRLSLQNQSLDSRPQHLLQQKLTQAIPEVELVSLLKMPAVQMRLYKFQRFNINALRNLLKHPVIPTVIPTGELRMAEQTAQENFPSDKTSFFCPPTRPPFTPQTLPPKAPGLVSAVLLRPGVYMPLEIPEPVIQPVSLPQTPCISRQAHIQQQRSSLKRLNYTIKTATVLRHAEVNERVEAQIQWFVKRPEYLQLVAERARPYLYHIVNELTKHRLPLELALLPIVESAYKPTALSPKSAAGLWQFIPSTARDFNLQLNAAYDDRLDVTASTQAAIRYLSYLHKHFNNDWLLALAAYNAGQGTVDAALKQNSAKGLAQDYWSLTLPEETQNYVPRLLALAKIFAHPARYHLHVKPVRNEPYFVKVNLANKPEILALVNNDLRVIAQLANLSFEHFARLNPGYLTSNLEATEALNFLIPVSNAYQLRRNLAKLQAMLPDSEQSVGGLLSVSWPDDNTATPQNITRPAI